MSALIEIKPQPGPQTAFLSSSADIIFYGGGAGGGKTWSLLLEAVRNVNNPRFSAVIFRRSYPQITAPGGLLDASMELYPLLGGRLRRAALEWTFPGGAKIVFRHLKLARDVFAWQGAEVPLICWDEATHFDESQFWYMMSRNRSTCGVRPYVRASCNPDPDSFVKELIEWWLTPDGFPDPEKSGVVRYFIRENGQLVWVDASYRDELGVAPKSITFIPSSIFDNPALLKANPEYLGNLRSLPELERQQLLEGNWKVKRVAGKVFKPEWFRTVHQLPQVVRWVRFWDFAATLQQRQGDDPDWSVGVLMGLLQNGSVIIADVYRQRLTPGGVDQQLKAVAAADGREVMVRWFKDPGQAGEYQSQVLRSQLPGYDAKGVASQISKDRRAGPLSRAAEFGELLLAADHWNHEFINELVQFPDGNHDDQVDAAAGAYLELTGEGMPRFGQARYQ